MIYLLCVVFITVFNSPSVMTMPLDNFPSLFAKDPNFASSLPKSEWPSPTTLSKENPPSDKVLFPKPTFPKLSDSDKSLFSHIESSSNSFSSRTETSDGETTHAEAAAAAQSAKIKTSDGHTEETESKAAAAAVQTTKTNSDGTKETVSAAADESENNSVKDGKAEHSEAKAAAVAESIKDPSGEVHSKAIAAGETKISKTGDDGKPEVEKTSTLVHSDKVTHADGKSKEKDEVIEVESKPTHSNTQANVNDDSSDSVRITKTEKTSDETGSERITNSEENLKEKQDKQKKSDDKKAQSEESSKSNETSEKREHSK